jgi:hypothetical protein
MTDRPRASRLQRIRSLRFIRLLRKTDQMLGRLRQLPVSTLSCRRLSVQSSVSAPQPRGASEIEQWRGRALEPQAVGATMRR